MPRPLAWKALGENLSMCEAGKSLEEFRSYTIYKGMHSVHGRSPQMRCLRLGCASASCKTHDSFTKCSWTNKVLISLLRERKWIYELGEHNINTGLLKNKRLMPTQKDFCREMAKNEFGHSAFTTQCFENLHPADSAAISKNDSESCDRMKMKNHDRVKETEEWIHASAFDGTEDESRTFTFSCDNDDSGKPIVSNGCDEASCFIGLSTKALIQILSEPSAHFIFHVDVTFKINNHNFHLRFYRFTASEWIYEVGLRVVKHLYRIVTGEELNLHHVMGYAEAGQYNAVCSVFGAGPGIQFLMCFFHVMTNVNEPEEWISLILIVQDIYEIHLAYGEADVMVLREAVARKWICSIHLILRDICKLSGCTSHLANGRLTLTFDYTLNRRLKLGMLLRQLRNGCQIESSNGKVVRRELERQQALIRRTLELKRNNFLHLGLVPTYCPGLVTGSPRYAGMNVVSIPAPRIKLIELGKTQEALKIPWSI
ncbi:LOW QUALITY PROTEIN: hypothetical protein PHMEG_0008539 [Phytophthora megakarya]|uniref:MULE transposase domain-containing protein n=1 Tax=Phytophthora megakarya TaxID=4795 RepID=A0A225WIH4_9STRA|nr:LOW QUALITY PROTEIN: hypothetical protein PHMEG_0008539 [Phytophthora megakarya]